MIRTSWQADAGTFRVCHCRGGRSSRADRWPSPRGGLSFLSARNALSTLSTKTFRRVWRRRALIPAPLAWPAQAQPRRCSPERRRRDSGGGLLPQRPARSSRRRQRRSPSACSPFPGNALDQQTIGDAGAWSPVTIIIHRLVTPPEARDRTIRADTWPRPWPVLRRAGVEQRITSSIPSPVWDKFFFFVRHRHQRCAGLRHSARGRRRGRPVSLERHATGALNARAPPPNARPSARSLTTPVSRSTWLTRRTARTPLCWPPATPSQAHRLFQRHHRRPGQSRLFARIPSSATWSILIWTPATRSFSASGPAPWRGTAGL